MVAQSGLSQSTFYCGEQRFWVFVHGERDGTLTVVSEQMGLAHSLAEQGIVVDRLKI